MPKVPARPGAPRTVTPEQLVALEQRIEAALAREADRREQAARDVEQLVRTTVAALRTDLSREVVTEQLRIVDRMGRTWIYSTVNLDWAQFTVHHPDEMLGTSVAMSVTQECFDPAASLQVMASEDLIAELGGQSGGYLSLSGAAKRQEPLRTDGGAERIISATSDRHTPCSPPSPT